MKFGLHNKDDGLTLVINVEERELLYNALWYFHSFGEYTDEEEIEIIRTLNLLNLPKFQKTPQEENHKRISNAVLKQYPQKVKSICKAQIQGKRKYGGYCPTCNGAVVYDKTWLQQVRKKNYCTWCGQYLDWGQYEK